MEEGGVQVMILSNNRSSPPGGDLCRELGIPYVGHAQKPRTTGFHRAMEQAGVTAAETAMMGDKLLTDMLGANLAGVLALMVEPAGGPKAHGTGCSTPCRRPLRPSAAAGTHNFPESGEKYGKALAKTGHIM